MLTSRARSTGQYLMTGTGQYLMTGTSVLLIYETGIPVLIPEFCEYFYLTYACNMFRPYHVT
jgi:hypothetical protein